MLLDGIEMTRFNLSKKLVDIEDEIKRLDEEIQALQRQKQKLIHQKGQIEKQISLQNEDTSNNAFVWESDNFDWSEDCRRVLKNAFGFTDFRSLQRSAINSILSKNDTLVIMSTGEGKSLCYQLPAVFLQGVTLVVSPLISLIEDQIFHLRKLFIEAATLNQSTSKEETSYIQRALVDPQSSLRLLYVTPEKLARSKRLMNQLEKCAQLGRLKLIAIDEVHCCSQWGYDFRPDYKFLNILKRQFRDVPLLGLTATASSIVIEDVKDILSIPAATVFFADFNRPNLYYEVRQKPPPEEHVNEICSLIKDRFHDQSGIIYCFSRKECEDLAKNLRKKGIRAAYYHAYLESEKRTQTHERWVLGEIQVIVATVAFGMGIDKPDVRFVIHHSMAKSVENYYQESGRAGRDGREAVCILYFRISDLFRQSTMVCTEKNGLNYLYVMLNYCLKKNLCRRTIFAELYNMDWDAALCDQKCDVCAKKTSSKMVDVTSLWKDMDKILKDHEAKKDGNRITGTKLIDLAIKKNRQLYREFVETALANLLLQQYFEEDFHFTPYSIISYIRPTAKSSRYVDNLSHRIEIEVADDVAGGKSKICQRKRKRISSSEGDC